jgi:hypothetical protein
MKNPIPAIDAIEKMLDRIATLERDLKLARLETNRYRKANERARKLLDTALDLTPAVPQSPSTADIEQYVAQPVEQTV